MFGTKLLGQTWDRDFCCISFFRYARTGLTLTSGFTDTLYAVGGAEVSWNSVNYIQVAPYACSVCSYISVNSLLPFECGLTPST